jgi:hypothetical protein
MVLHIQNIKDKLMGLHDVGFRSPHYPQSIEFLWVDEHIEGVDSQYRIGFTYGGTEYSTYLHRYPQTTNHYYMGCYGPNMKEYRLIFTKDEFRLSSIFVSSLILKLNLAIC